MLEPASRDNLLKISERISSIYESLSTSTKIRKMTIVFRSARYNLGWSIYLNVTKNRT